MPKPPASLTAATRRLPEITSIGASRIGCLIPSSVVNTVAIAMSSLDSVEHDRQLSRQRTMKN
jgi:hypothetical protein